MSNVFLKLTGAIVVSGHVVKPPAIVETTEAEARDYLRRGKAVLATEADMPAHERTPSAEVATPAAEPEPAPAPAKRRGKNS